MQKDWQRKKDNVRCKSVPYHRVVIFIETKPVNDCDPLFALKAFDFVLDLRYGNHELKPDDQYQDKSLVKHEDLPQFEQSSNARSQVDKEQDQHESLTHRIKARTWQEN